jgi:hypothetical protein
MGNIQRATLDLESRQIEMQSTYHWSDLSMINAILGSAHGCIVEAKRHLQIWMCWNLNLELGTPWNFWNLFGPLWTLDLRTSESPTCVWSGVSIPYNLFPTLKVVIVSIISFKVLCSISLNLSENCTGIFNFSANKLASTMSKPQVFHLIINEECVMDPEAYITGSFKSGTGIWSKAEIRNRRQKNWNPSTVLISNSIFFHCDCSCCRFQFGEIDINATFPSSSLSIP